METKDAFGILLFFSLFEVIGGAAFGSALRALLARDLSGCFLLIWGAGFAGIPLAIGAATFLSTGQTSFFYAQVFVLLAAIVTLALMPRDFWQAGDSTGAEGTALVGAVLTMAGGGVVLLNLKEGIGVPLLVGGMIAFIGVWLLIRTSIRAIRAL